jgi:hypothetical protein
VLLKHLFIAAAQDQTKFDLQFVKVSKFAPYVGQLFLQPAPDRRTRLQAIPSQSQESSNLTELESQTLHATDKGQRLYIILCVSTEASFGPGWPRKQTVALVEANRINAQPDPFRDDANLH